MLNPKTALFFLAFLPQFAEPSGNPVVVQVILLGLLARSRLFARAQRCGSAAVCIGLGVGAAVEAGG